MTILVELWEYDLTMEKDYKECLLGSTEVVANLNNLHLPLNKMLVLTNSS